MSTRKEGELYVVGQWASDVTRYALYILKDKISTEKAVCPFLHHAKQYTVGKSYRALYIRLRPFAARFIADTRDTCCVFCDTW
jgi:hypothetical protein